MKKASENKWRRMTPPERSELMRLWNEGLTVAEIAARIGFHHNSIRAYLRGRGLFLNERRHLAQNEVDGVIEWYERGVEVAEICRQFHIAEPVLYRHLRRQGVTLRRKLGRRVIRPNGRGRDCWRQTMLDKK